MTPDNYLYHYNIITGVDGMAFRANRADERNGELAQRVETLAQTYVETLLDLVKADNRVARFCFERIVLHDDLDIPREVKERILAEAIRAWDDIAVKAVQVDSNTNLFMSWPDVNHFIGTEAARSSVNAARIVIDKAFPDENKFIPSLLKEVAAAVEKWPDFAPAVVKKGFGSMLPALEDPKPHENLDIKDVVDKVLSSTTACREAVSRGFLGSKATTSTTVKEVITKKHGAEFADLVEREFVGSQMRAIQYLARDY